MPRAARLSTRNAKGRRWHGKGYRQRGELYVQLKRTWFWGGKGFSRGHSVNENATMAEFIDAMLRDLSMEDGFPLPDGLFISLQAFRGQELQQTDEPVKTYFDGAEMVHAKVFDDNGVQYHWDTIQWHPK